MNSKSIKIYKARYYHVVVELGESTVGFSKGYFSFVQMLQL